jgi:uncharacterized radical SAM superfamily Fe-S cluster-containing enzyme
MGERVKRITVKGFMDIHTMVEDRLLQCCVHAGAVADGRPVAMPFCAAQTWPALGAMKVSGGQAVVAEAARSSPSSRIEISRMRNF